MEYKQADLISQFLADLVSESPPAITLATITR